MYVYVSQNNLKNRVGLLKILDIRSKKIGKSAGRTKSVNKQGVKLINDLERVRQSDQGCNTVLDKMIQME